MFDPRVADESDPARVAFLAYREDVAVVERDGQQPARGALRRGDREARVSGLEPEPREEEAPQLEVPGDPRSLADRADVPDEAKEFWIGVLDEVCRDRGSREVLQWRPVTSGPVLEIRVPDVTAGLEE